MECGLGCDLYTQSHRIEINKIILILYLLAAFSFSIFLVDILILCPQHLVHAVIYLGARSQHQVFSLIINLHLIS